MELAEPRTGKGAQVSLRGTAVPQRDVLRGRARGATTEATRAGAREEAQQQERAASEGQRREPRTRDKGQLSTWPEGACPRATVPGLGAFAFQRGALVPAAPWPGEHRHTEGPRRA